MYICIYICIYIYGLTRWLQCALAHQETQCPAPGVVEVTVFQRCGSTQRLVLRQRLRGCNSGRCASGLTRNAFPLCPPPRPPVHEQGP